MKYEKGKTQLTANFDSTELEAFNAELNEPTIKPTVESRQILPGQQSQPAHLTY